MNFVFSIRKNFCLLLCVIFIISGLWAKDKKFDNVPLWAREDTINQAFPTEEYFASRGFADSAEKARINADADLSAFFNSRVSSVVSSIEKFSSAQYNSDSQTTSSEKHLVRKVDVASDSELFALRHTEPYYEKKTKRYVVCAYINRDEAWSVIEPRLDSCSKNIERVIQEAEQEKETFSKILFLNLVLSDAQEFYNLYFTALGLVPKNVRKYSLVDSYIQNAQVQKQKMVQKINLLLKVEGDKTGRIKTKLEETLSRQGFSVVSANKAILSDSIYIIDSVCDVAVDDSFGIFICYPQISIAVKKNDNVTLISWAKHFPKVSSYTKEACERMALHKIELEIENNFISECLNKR